MKCEFKRCRKEGWDLGRKKGDKKVGNRLARHRLSRLVPDAQGDPDGIDDEEYFTRCPDCGAMGCPCYCEEFPYEMILRYMTGAN